MGFVVILVFNRKNLFQSFQPIDKKLAGPAGVKPNEIEAYFGEKQPVTGTATNTQAPPGQTLSASQQSKSRAASTTGVVGEVKKQV